MTAISLSWLPASKAMALSFFMEEIFWSEVTKGFSVIYVIVFSVYFVIKIYTTALTRVVNNL